MAGKTLSLTPHIDASAQVRVSELGTYCEVGARTMLLEVTMGDYSYVVNDSQIVQGGSAVRSALIQRYGALENAARLSPTPLGGEGFSERVQTRHQHRIIAPEAALENRQNCD